MPLPYSPSIEAASLVSSLRSVGSFGAGSVSESFSSFSFRLDFGRQIDVLDSDALARRVQLWPRSGFVGISGECLGVVSDESAFHPVSPPGFDIQIEQSFFGVGEKLLGVVFREPNRKLNLDYLYTT